MGIIGMEAVQSKSLAMQSGYPSGIKAIGLPGVATATTPLRAQRMSPVTYAAASNLRFSLNRSSKREPTSAHRYRLCHCFTRENSSCAAVVRRLPTNSPFSSASGGRRGGQGGPPPSAGFVGSESWRCSGRRKSGSKGFRGGQHRLIASHPPTANSVGRCHYYSVAVFTADFHLRRVGAKSGNLIQKIPKVAASSIFSWLTRKGRILGTRPVRCSSTDHQWRTDAVRILWARTSSIERAGIDRYFSRLPKRKTPGAIRSTSSYLSDFGGNLSSQAAKDRGAAVEESSSLLDQQRSQGLRSDCRSEVFLASGFGWRVRDAERGEMRELMRVADIQTNAFHERSAIFDELFQKIFHAEVLTSLQYKSRQFDPNRYSCLLAEMDPLQPTAVEEAGFGEIEQKIVGAVDLTALDDKDVLCHLPGADEYLYVSGMAVDPEYRRRGVATLLLEACLARAMEWSFNYLVLHAYEDDFRARNLYSRAGYNVVAADPAWMSKFLGRRRRVVMAKRLDGEVASPLEEVF